MLFVPLCRQALSIVPEWVSCVKCLNLLVALWNLRCWFTRQTSFDPVALLHGGLVWISRFYCFKVPFAPELLKRACKFEQSRIPELIFMNAKRQTAFQFWVEVFLWLLFTCIISTITVKENRRSGLWFWYRLVITQNKPCLIDVFISFTELILTSEKIDCALSNIIHSLFFLTHHTYEMYLTAQSSVRRV